jgi:hypothetical protein
MITSGGVSARLLHHHRRVEPRHAQKHDFAGAMVTSTPNRATREFLVSQRGGLDYPPVTMAT